MMVLVKVEELIKKGDGRDIAKANFTIEDLSLDAELGEVFRKLYSEGYCKPRELVRRNEGDTHHLRFHEWSYTTEEHPSERIEVVVDKPSDFPAKQINVDDTFIHFYNNEGQDTIMTAEIQRSSPPDAGTLVIDGSLEITFHRTLRMPDDNKLHTLPQSLGTFPLYNVDAFSSRLPAHIIERSGFFFPMWQREAMWFQFKNTSSNSKYAIRINVGKINAISGLPIHEVARKQDYVVVPRQPWLDGIAVEPGVVRQFVAMPLGGGYTVEGQITGEENFGGIQIEVIPSYGKLDRMSFSHETEEGIWRNIEEAQTPRDYGLVGGSKISVVPNPPAFVRPTKIRDFYREGEVGGGVQCLLLKAEYPDYYRGLRENTQQFSLGSHTDPATEGRTIAIDDSSPSQKAKIISLFSRLVSRRSKTNSPVPAIKSSTTSSSVKQIHLFGDPEDSSEGLTEEHSFGISSDRIVMSPAMSPPIRQGCASMGMAAGGKLVQDIYADTNPKHIWNKSNTRLVNIHILNSFTFEEVTHIVPPRTPITANMYNDLKLPAFLLEEELNDRVDGGNSLKGIQSVSAMDKKMGIDGSSDTAFNPLKPKKCGTCEARLCDCIVRPCNHQYCNVCIKRLEGQSGARAPKEWKCPICSTTISRVAGFSAPMNLPGEEAFKVDVTVTMLKINDGRVAFDSIVKMRM